MLPIYERIGKLCKLKKTTINEMMIAVAPEDVKSPRDIYNGWRRRNTYPRADEIVRIANYLNVSVEYLVTGEDKDFPKDFYCKYKEYENLIMLLPKLSSSELRVVEDVVKSMAK